MILLPLEVVFVGVVVVLFFEAKAVVRLVINVVAVAVVFAVAVITVVINVAAVAVVFDVFLVGVVADVDTRLVEVAAIVGVVVVVELFASVDDDTEKTFIWIFVYTISISKISFELYGQYMYLTLIFSIRNFFVIMLVELILKRSFLDCKDKRYSFYVLRYHFELYGQYM